MSFYTVTDDEPDALGKLAAAVTDILNDTCDPAVTSTIVRAELYRDPELAKMSPHDAARFLARFYAETLP